MCYVPPFGSSLLFLDKKQMNHHTKALFPFLPLSRHSPWKIPPELNYSVHQFHAKIPLATSLSLFHFRPFLLVVKADNIPMETILQLEQSDKITA